MTGVRYSSVAWGDYDNDGDLDILIIGDLGANQPLTKLYRNNGDNTFTEQTAISIISVRAGSIAWGDYDNDGDLDILLTGSTGAGGISKIYRNNGDNTFTEQPSISLINVSYSSATWGDYDNDGDLDILLTGLPSPMSYTSKIYRNNGNNTFAEQTSIALTGIGYGSAAWGDYDNDGDLDVLLSGYDGSNGISKVFRNNGDNTFTEQTSISLIGLYRNSVKWGDYDNDGDLDILLTGLNGSNGVSKIYSNNNITSNSIPATPSNLETSINGNDVTFSWNKSADTETPQNGLKYNLVIGTSPDAVNTLSPMSDRSTGYRRVINLGNTNHNNSWTIKGLPDGEYYWSVQAIDNAFSGSNFAEEKSFEKPLQGEYTSDANTVLLLHMDENSGSIVNDASGYNNHGTATGTTIVDGRFGKARLFANTSEGISVSNSSSLDFGEQNFTIEGWIQSVSTIPCGIVGKHDGVTGYWVTYHGEAGGIITLYLDIEGQRIEAWSTTTLGDGKWHHFAAIRTSNQLKIFIDGILSGQTEETEIGSISNTVGVGIAMDNALLEEIRISNITRSPEEFNLQLPPKNLTGNFNGNDVTLNWENGGGAVPLMRYRIYHGADSVNVAIIDSTSSTNYIHANLPPGFHYYRVSAVDSTGFEGAKSFAVSIFLTGPVACYPFNGNAKDESGNSNNGTINGAVLTTDRFGNANSAYSFDGVSNYIVAVADPLPISERTISLWFYTDDLSTHPALIGYGGGDCGTSFLMIMNNLDNGADKFEVQGHCGVFRLNQSYPFNPRYLWHHWIVTTSADGTKFYLDNVLIASNNLFLNNTNVAGKDLAIGVGVSPDGSAPDVGDPNLGYFKGSLDDICIYNRVLSLSEIDSLYNIGGWNPEPPPLFGEYFNDANTVLLMHMNEEDGSAVNDVSDYNNNGTAIGTTIVDGKYGKARSLSTNGEYITISHSSSLNFGTNSFTLECWAKILGTSTDDGAFFHKRGSDAFGTGWSFYVHPDGKLAISIFSAQSTSLQGIGSINDGEWHHVAAVITSTAIKYFYRWYFRCFDGFYNWESR